MRILGIDPGSHVTGWGLVEKGGGGKLIHISSGTIALDEGMELSGRLLLISEGLSSVIRDLKPDAVSVESVFFARNVRSAITLGHARGVALLAAASSGLQVFEYAPRAIKQAVTGYGNAEKEQVNQMIKALLKITEPVKPDAADALAAAICHINHFHPGLHLHEQAVLKRKRASGAAPIKS
ncbi:MAG: crossover junction endodeoxyribonuclease RuvC [Deltaproteobacteria bacterium]|nr:crossover junction endodeoxyribonuclease RuvC [Deltaproteobacteria bacterium]